MKEPCASCEHNREEKGCAVETCKIAALSPVRSEPLLALLRRVHDEIDALDEGIPMSAETWEEMEDVLEATRRLTVWPERRKVEAILRNFEQGIKDGLAKALEANTVEPLVVFFPAQCECGHLYLERYMLPKERADGCVAFCWCGFCKTRRDVFKHNTEHQARADSPSPECSRSQEVQHG